MPESGLAQIVHGNFRVDSCAVNDRAIEVFGGLGGFDDFLLSDSYARARVLSIVEGPDAMHRMTIARNDLKRTSPYLGSSYAFRYRRPLTPGDDDVEKPLPLHR